MALTVKEIKDFVPTEQEWIIDQGLLIPGSKMVVYGSKKSYKSMLTTINLAYTLSQGGLWLEKFHTAKSKVLVIQVEIPFNALRDRVMKYSNEHDIVEPDNLWYESIRLRLNKPDGYKKVSRLIAEYRPDVLILDCMYKLMYGDVSNNEVVGLFTDAIDRLVDETEGHLAVILIHHKGKKTIDKSGRFINRGSEATLGASTLMNWCDTSIGINVPDVRKPELVLSFEDMRLSDDSHDDLYLIYNKKKIDFYLREGPDLAGGFVRFTNNDLI